MSKLTDKELADRFARQTTLSVYGDGPVDAGLGRPVGCEDVAQIKLLPGFVVVRTDWLDALEALVKTQAQRIAQLERSA